MNPRRILIALVLALFASGLCTWYASRRMAAPQITRRSPDQQYAAPSRELSAGVTLRPDDIELETWPGALPIDGAYSRIADVSGREVLFPLAKGQPILARDLAAPGTGAGLATRIPDGMRAVALRSDEVVGVAGFLVPGSHLDVLVTCRTQGAPDPITATVLQNVVVLAVGHQSEPDPEGKASDVTLVTLLLTPDQAQRAVLASAQGAIHFVLRNGGDSSEVSGAPTLLSQLAGQPVAVTHSVNRVSAPASPLPVKRFEIETILGDGSSDKHAVASPPSGAGQ